MGASGGQEREDEPRRPGDELISGDDVGDGDPLRPEIEGDEGTAMASRRVGDGMVTAAERAAAGLEPSSKST